MKITFETPNQPGVHELIGELDAYLYSLYPADNVYALDISSLSHPSVLFAVVRDTVGTAVGCGAIVIKPDYGELKRMYVTSNFVSIRSAGDLRAHQHCNIYPPLLRTMRTFGLQ